jgi:hypothetical protein
MAIYHKAGQEHGHKDNQEVYHHREIDMLKKI